MNYRGRQIDPVSFWSRYVDFPPNLKIDGRDQFSPKVVCPNPEHDTLKSHFQVNLQQPLVHCFARCGIEGSYEHAVCVIEGLYEKFKVEEATDKRERQRRLSRAYREARKIILRSSRFDSKISRSAPVKKKHASARSASTVSSESLQYESFLPPVALEYLTARGITSEAVAEWKIGWLPEEKRIVIPGEDENGVLRLLIKRGISDKQRPKYLYTEGFPKTSLLFGACKLDLGLIKSDGLVLVEGSVDVIALRQEGIKNAVAILGTGISDKQVRVIARLKPSRIYLFFDKDSAGIRNIEIAISKLCKYPLYVVRYPKGLSDPAEAATKAQRQIDRAVPAYKFLRANNLNVKTRERRIPVG